jgi:DNA transformation protein
MTKLSTLKGLGPKSEKCLNEIGIYTKEELQESGAINTFIKLKNECSIKPGLNFLYAIVGALEDKHWADIAKTEKTRLILELDGYQDLEKILKADDIKNKI